MAEIHAPGELPWIPDDLTAVQFMLDAFHPTRPVVTKSTPWFIEDATGRDIGPEEVRARVYGLANALKARWKLAEDDIVCVYSPNHLDYLPALWAVYRLGGIITPANPSYTAGELEHQLSLTRAKFLLADPGNLRVALIAAAKVGLPNSHIALFDNGKAPGEYVTISQLVEEGLAQPSQFVERKLEKGEARRKLALLSFSSGTTGRPKAVRIPHYSLCANVVQMAAYHKMSWASGDLPQKFQVGDVVFAPLPFYHIYGLLVIGHFFLYAGMSLVIVPKFNFTNMLKSIERHRINHLPLVPPMAVLLCKHPAVNYYDLSSVKAIMCGAAPLSGEIVQRLSERFPQVTIGQGFGMTETATIVTMPQLDQKIGTLGSAGRLVPGIVVRVIKEDGSLAQCGEPGQLVVRGPSIALGYLNNEEATKETFRDGWLYSGDEVIINESAEMFVVDRIKELIKVRGFQVAPAELEGHLLEHSDVMDACVVSVPDDYSGELPLAFVVLRPQASARAARDPAEAQKIKVALQKHVADAKIYYKQLTGGVVFTDAIPKNPSGKLLRRFLRDRARLMQKNGELGSEIVQAKL
ncbi:acetyl-CoA synthetase-like protein [Obba rivulosa]|uniref:Acetyl-CoA synthetase-like protein n=1 Tax=Obba rivulosa TaxID=1052685 RepID=A0A8E2AQU7_9APHY|nr:acetyl-CoA synthetase-like protein [Obba rivulosa]